MEQDQRDGARVPAGVWATVLRRDRIPTRSQMLIAHLNNAWGFGMPLSAASLGAGEVIAETAVIKHNSIVKEKGEDYAWNG